MAALPRTNMKSKPLVFFGTDSFSTPALEALHAGGYAITAVVTKPDRPAGRGRALKTPAVKELADSLGLPVYQPEKLDGFLNTLKTFKATAAVAVSYGAIIPKEVIEAFPEGVINIHPSLLPKYRGASPIETTILNGDTETGVTLMRIDEGIDSGPIFTQAKISLSGNETKQELYELLSKLGAQLLIENLEAILDGQIKPKQQDLRLVSMSRLIKKEDGIIAWSKPARQIEREIRAYAGWPGSHTTLFDHEVIITQATATETATKHKPGEVLVTEKQELAITCSPGILVIERLKPAGKNEMTGSAFIAGYRK